MTTCPKYLAALVYVVQIQVNGSTAWILGGRKSYPLVSAKAGGGILLQTAPEANPTLGVQKLRSRNEGNQSDV